MFQILILCKSNCVLTYLMYTEAQPLTSVSISISYVLQNTSKCLRPCTERPRAHFYLRDFLVPLVAFITECIILWGLVARVRLQITKFQVRIPGQTGVKFTTYACRQEQISRNGREKEYTYIITKQ